MKKISLFIFLQLACLNLYAQQYQRAFTFRDVDTGEQTRLEIGDKVLMLFDYVYCAKNFNKITTKILTAQDFSQSNILQGKARILRITDSSLVFTDGSHTPLAALRSLKKLTFAKQVARSLGIRTDRIPVTQLTVVRFAPNILEKNIVEKPAVEGVEVNTPLIVTPNATTARIYKDILPAHLRRGDKVLLGYKADYYAKNPKNINAYVLNPRKPKYGRIFYGKERILHITDSSLIFADGTHAHFNSLLVVRKLSFGKRVLRTIGTITGGFLVFYGSLAVVAGIVVALIAPEAIIVSLFGTFVGIGGNELIINNNNRVKRKHVLQK